MPRKKKIRCCNCSVAGNIFKPVGIPMHNLDKVNLEIDELESLRLCDYEGLTQEEAGDKMGISRATVQRLLYSGRKKIIDALLSTKALVLISDNK
jgi:predicted DNA-binding protein (UPF0251 family)